MQNQNTLPNPKGGLLALAAQQIQGVRPPPRGQDLATPEEQRQYERVTLNAMRLIYDPQTRDGVREMLIASGDQVSGLADATELVVNALEALLLKAGRTIPIPILVSVTTNEVIPSLIEVGEVGGGPPWSSPIGGWEYTPTQIDQAIRRVMMWLGNKLRMEGRVSEEEAMDAAEILKPEREQELKEHLGLEHIQPQQGAGILKRAQEAI